MYLEFGAGLNGKQVLKNLEFGVITEAIWVDEIALGMCNKS